MKRQISELSEVPRKRIFIKRSKDVQERINEERRMAIDKANEILRPLFNARKNKVTFAMPPPISEVLIIKRRPEESEVPQKRSIIKRSKNIKERKNEERKRVVEKDNEILQPSFNARKKKVTFATPISDVRIIQREGRKDKGVEEDEKPLMEVKDSMDAMELVELKIPQISMIPIKKRNFTERKRK
ncbi:992_t:CDS:2 [Diversispora eburnea]|uniref:992_t:CDS:1 n=1 Tax=Diversispora eburnea TaxID=1213867 RepID=A0A9N8W7M5_9GLOM|nr:992_t:CDS:2 [Diversispora eburnea]